MLSHQPLHPALEGLLRFEEQRLGLPVEVYHQPLQRFDPAPPFRPAIELRIHSGGLPESFPILLADELLEVKASIQVISDGQEVGFPDRSGRPCPLASVKANVISLFFDLDSLYRNPAAVRQVGNHRAAAADIRLVNRIAGLVLEPAANLALGNIRRYDWRREQEDYTRRLLSLHEQTVEEWRQSFRNCEREISDKLWEVRRLTARTHELRLRLQAAEQLTRKRLERQARDDHAGLVRLLGRGLASFQLEGPTLRATTSPITIMWRDSSYELGSFVISLPVGEGRLAIRSLDGRAIEGYPHPHISGDGTPCLGNIGPVVAELLGQGEWLKLVLTLLEFLRSYNPDNPYLRLERWDPDWEEDDDSEGAERWRSCYDNASMADCATCGEEECPHRYGAERRCFEFTDTADCIGCGECPLQHEAVTHCRENHTAADCVACDQEGCPHAGVEEDCYGAHGGDQCAECDNERCTHHPPSDEEDKQ